ncbi:L-threonylcarbamoyladenylate synthase [Candidatus Ichthyocystis hellenicum]|uniref:L-threonylcarbamoyladenylate synthase n=1 Tax=Candidatus Ichthyocystis hellenicum TaxID=1561003 RepID=UPI000AB8AC14|nr:L-threonylcarbamoyladenylate synthase [Candidatus Ichthyocystis hellenicum]
MNLLTIEQSVKFLLGGELVAIPTETVYGLAADASNDSAVRKIFSAKGRPLSHPLIVHVHSFEDIFRWAVVENDYVELLCKAYWPGPLTIVLKKRDSVLPSIVAGRETVAVRVPQHSATTSLLDKLKENGCFGVVAPSANVFGRVSSTMPSHVFDDFGYSIAGILDGGFCCYGVESTIVDCSGKTPRLLRKGRIRPDAMEEVCGVCIERGVVYEHETPGSLPGHYAPVVPLALVGEDDFHDLLDVLRKEGDVGVLARTVFMPEDLTGVYWTRMPDLALSYACRLYERLRFLEKFVKNIIVEKPPQDSAWEDINDRLIKASYGSRSH